MGNEISTCCASGSAVKTSHEPQEKGAEETTGSLQAKKDSPKKAEPVSTNAPQGRTGPKGGTHQALRLLGRGTAADTWLFRDIKLSKPVAIKMFQRPIDSYPVSAVQREVMTQTELGPGHLNLINVYELFLTPEHLGLVMECAGGGSLTTYVGGCWEKAQPHSLVLPEDEVLYLFKQFISAVAYCHSHTIAHRDLKLDNTLLDGSDPPILKICDFGFARHFDSPLERTASHLGTPEYMSPELLHVTEGGKHDQYDPRSVDVWASGVLLLVCLCGAFPFDHTAHNVSQPQDNETDLWLQEVSKNWSESSFIAHNVQALSPEVRDLLDKIFKVDPKKRITVRGIMEHPWYNKQLPAKYQDALDRIEEQQAVLEKHVQQIKLDPEKVSQRQQAIQEMIEESGTKDDSTQRKSAMRPLHMLDMNHEDLSSIDLTEQAVLAEESTHGGNSALEKERFANDGVRQAVDRAFSKSGSQSEISSAVNEVQRQGAPVGGGTV